MGNEVVVGVWDSADDLFEKETGVFFTDFVILNVVVELSAFCEFHDDENVVAGVEDFIELNDVVVVNEFEDADLSFDLGCPMSTFEIMCLLFILRLLMILTATLTPVRSCRASISQQTYISPLRTLPSR